MATFAVDLLTGNKYLLTGDFNTTGTTSGSTYPAVNTYADLPAPVTVSGEIYVVRSGSGAFIVNRKPSGFYFSNGSVWKFMGETPDFFKSNNFNVYDANDTSKGVMFTTSGITTNVFRKLNVQNSDGTIAYTSDVDLKANTSLFNQYTGNTQSAINSKLNSSIFNAYTATTYLTGENIQVVSTQTSNANTIIPINVIWNTVQYSGTSFLWSGGTAVWIKISGVFRIGYHILLTNDASNETHCVGASVLKNGVIIATTSGAGIVSGINGNGEISLPPVIVSLLADDKLELTVFRIGDSGNANLTAGSVYMIISELK